MKRYYLSSVDNLRRNARKLFDERTGSDIGKDILLFTGKDRHFFEKKPEGFPNGEYVFSDGGETVAIYELVGEELQYLQTVRASKLYRSH